MKRLTFNMIRFFKFFFALIAFLSYTISCQEKMRLSAIYTEFPEYTIKVGECISVDVHHSPAELPSPTYFVIADDSNIISVESSLNPLRIKGVKPGQTFVTITTHGEQLLTTKFIVNVTPITIDEILLNQSALTINEGDEFTLHATIKPYNATNKTLIWSSSNENIVTVNNGHIKAISQGSAIITVTNNDTSVQASCDVHVVVPVSSILLDMEFIELVQGEEKQLTAIVLPNNATNKNIKWESNNTNVATINNGIVKAIDKGVAIVTAETEDGKKIATCKVSVRLHTESLDKNEGIW